MRLFCLVLTVLALAGCKMNDALDATNSVPTKMDETNRKIDATNEKMDETQEAIRLQKLGIAKVNLEDPDNAKTLQPLPAGMMGYAKLFAETATAEELVGQIYLYVTEINRGVFPAKVDAEGKAVAPDAQGVADTNQYKMQRFVAAQAISAFIPKEMMSEIVETEILNEGRYKATALNILLMRFTFTSQILLDKSLFDDELTSVGMVEKALEYIENMETIAKYSFVDQVTLKIYGFAGQEALNLNLNDAEADILSRLETMDFQISYNLETVDMSELDENPAVSKKLQIENQKRLDSAVSDVQKKLAFWSNTAA